MFDFLRRQILGQRITLSKSEQARPGVQLLASVLVCFPEIEAVSYEPSQGLLTMDFVVRAQLSPAELEEFAAFLAESIETYHVLEDSVASELNFSFEQHDALMMIHLARRMDELQLLTDRFGEALIIDPHGAEALDAEFRMVQHETLERMLMAVREFPLRDRLVGIRECDQVVVYNR